MKPPNRWKRGTAVCFTTRIADTGITEGAIISVNHDRAQAHVAWQMWDMYGEQLKSWIALEHLSVVVDADLMLLPEGGA